MSYGTYLPSSVPQHHAKIPAAADLPCSIPAPHAGTCYFWADRFALADWKYAAWLSSLESAWCQIRALLTSQELSHNKETSYMMWDMAQRVGLCWLQRYTVLGSAVQLSTGGLGSEPKAYTPKHKLDPRSNKLSVHLASRHQAGI